MVSSLVDGSDMVPLRLQVFRFVIKSCGSLRNQPRLTKLFDAGLGLLTVVTAPRVTAGITAITDGVTQWPNVTRSPHRLGGRQFNRNGAELGHIHSNGVADVRLTRREHDDVVSRRLAELHHVAPQSTWVTAYIEGPQDIERVVALFRIPFERLTHAAEHPSEITTEEA